MATRKRPLYYSQRQCEVRVRVFFADPGTQSGYGTVEGRIPCGLIRWNSDRPPASFTPRLTDIYQMSLGVCPRGDGSCKEATLDLDVGPQKVFRKRRK
jgi:hypothetical protein